MFMILKEMLQEQFKDGKAKGKAEGKAEDILDLLNDLPGEISEELKNLLSAENDCDVLRKYLKLAASASSVEEFVQQLPK